MINVYISDLFFNHDVSRCWNRPTNEKGGHYDRDKLENEACQFLGMLNALGVDTPRPAELVDDFMNRL